MLEEKYVCETTKGQIEIILKEEWSPLGVERFRELVEGGFFESVPLFRCVSNFLCQFGYKHRKENEKEWDNIKDDVPTENTPRKFKRGYLSFAGNGKNSRSSHLFVTLGEHVSSLGKELWETPIGYVTSQSMEEVVSKWTTKYGDMPPWGKGPDPGKIESSPSTYLEQSFPDLDYITTCTRKKKSSNIAEVVATKRNPRIYFDLEPLLGRIVIELYPSKAPLGVDRIQDLVKTKFLNEARFFRVVPGFVVQFGMPGDPNRAKEFQSIKDEPVILSNTRGTISFATSGPNTRNFQLFINLGDNSRLDNMQFTPIGKVISGMEFVDKINSEYRELPNQALIAQDGNEYLKKNYPRLSYIKEASFLSEDPVQVKENQFQTTTQPFQRGVGLEFWFSVLMVFLVFCCYFCTVRILFKSPKPARG